MSIYSQSIQFECENAILPSMKGLGAYKRMFSMFRWLPNFVHGADMAHRLVYDPVLKQVRVRWNLKLWMRPQEGRSVEPMEYDGVSLYLLNEEGLVSTHRLEFKQRIDPTELAPLFGYGFSRNSLALNDLVMQSERLPSEILSDMLDASKQQPK